MAIPSNLLAINSVISEELSSLIPTQVTSSLSLPSNLLPINATQINESLQSLAGKIPSSDTIPEIPYYSTLNTAIPDQLFTTGSIDQIQQRALRAGMIFMGTLPTPRIIPSIPTLRVPIPAFPPRRPSYGNIKSFIKTKIDRIKQQKQKASMKALKEELKKQENPFQYRKNLTTINQRNVANTVLGRFK